MSKTMQGVATTVEMYAAVDSVRTVISQLIECNLEAWKKLPQQMKDLMISSPQKFRFIQDPSGKPGSPPKIVYNGIVLKYGFQDTYSGCWLLDDLMDN